MKDLHSIGQIEQRIYVLRGHRVILDADLAVVYGVSTRRLNEQIRRNRDRFPSDFAFVLNRAEFDSLMSQTATSNAGRGGRRKLPFVFTEHGAVMAANVLNSPVAVRASIHVVRAFIRLREIIGTHKNLARQLDELEQKFQAHDAQFRVVFQAIRQLMRGPSTKRTKPSIGFKPSSAPQQARLLKTSGV